MGSTEQEQKSRTKTDPWKPTVPTLTNLVGQINGQTGNTAVTGNENAALDTLTQNAQAGNPYAPQIGNLASDLFAGGVDRSGTASDAYSAYKDQLSPFATAQHYGPDGNPGLKGYLDTISNDVQNRVNGMFAGAGRDFSGANLNSLARGIAEGTAPILAQQYNTDVGRQFDAANSLYGAGNTTTGLLSGLDQTRLGNRQTGIGVGQDALNARDSGANQLLNVEQQRRSLPLTNIGNLESLITPLAQLGGTQKSHTTGEVTPPLGMQLVQAYGIMNGRGGSGWGGGTAGAPQAAAAGGK